MKTAQTAGPRRERNVNRPWASGAVPVLEGGGPDAKHFPKPRARSAPPPVQPTGLRLTRRAIAAFARWRETEGPARESWEGACGLHPGEVRALETLAGNLIACGQPISERDLLSGSHNGGWFNRDRLRPEIARQLLAGLFVPEDALRDLVRLVAMPGWHERWVQTALEDLLGPGWEWERQAREARRLVMERERAAREAYRLQAPAAEPGPSWGGARPGAGRKPQARGGSEQAEEREETPVTATMTEAAAPNGLRPWREKPAGLTEGQTAVWDELERRGLDIREYVSWTQKQAIGVQLRISAGAVQQNMQTIAKKLGLKLPKADSAQREPAEIRPVVAAPGDDDSPRRHGDTEAEGDASLDGALVEIRPEDAETETPEEPGPALARGELFAGLVADAEQLRRDRDETARMLGEVQRERDALTTEKEQLWNERAALRGDIERLRTEYEEAGQTIERLRDEANLLARERDEALREPAAEAESHVLDEDDRTTALGLAYGVIPELFAAMDLSLRLRVLRLAGEILAVAVGKAG